VQAGTAATPAGRPATGQPQGGRAVSFEQYQREMQQRAAEEAAREAERQRQIQQQMQQDRAHREQMEQQNIYVVPQ
jgi:hypothetical protein